MNISLDKVSDKTETYHYEEEAQEYRKKGFNYVIKTDKVKDVIQEEIERSHINTPDQYYIIAGGMRNYIPEYPFLIPCYRSLFHVREQMFAARYRGLCQTDNHLWISNGWECNVYMDTIDYQITHHFYSAMTRDVIPKIEANDFPYNEMLSYDTSWLKPEDSEFTLDTVFFDQKEGRIENTQKCRDFLLAIIYLSSQDTGLDPYPDDLKDYIDNFPKLFETPQKNIEKVEKSIRKVMMKKTEEDIKMHFLKVCDENKVLAEAKLLEEKKLAGPKEDAELMLGIICSHEKRRERKKRKLT